LSVLTIALAAFACGNVKLRAATLHIDTFDSSVQGWEGGASPAFVPTGGAGDGGGFLRLTAGSNLATHNDNSSWIGNLAAIGADRINVDLMAPLDSDSLEIRVVLFGPSTTQDRWTSAVSQTVPNDGVWRNFTFPLGAGHLVAPQPAGTYEQVMASVLRVMLRHDPGTPSHGGEFVNGKLGIDNLELAASPPPMIPGDFDGDSDVDVDDLFDAELGWQARFGDDLTGDDFLVWQQNLGSGLPAGDPPATPVPEPIAIVLGLSAVVATRCLSQRRKDAETTQRKRTENLAPHFAP
jgi:hypothetical protein